MRPFDFSSLIIICLLISGCGHTEKINLQEQHFKGSPTKIIWIQLTGFDESHLAINKLSGGSFGEILPLEKSSCFGKIWNYNISSLRPNENDSFFSQLVGTPNEKGSCDGQVRSGQTAVIHLSDKEIDPLLESGLSCIAGNNKPYYWKIGGKILNTSGTKNFLHQRPEIMNSPDIYVDQGCPKGECYSDFQKIVEMLYLRLTKNRSNYLLIIRDDFYSQNLKQGNVVKARFILSELMKLYALFNSMAAEDDKMLVLLSGASPLGLEFPSQGLAFKELEKSNKTLKYRESLLLSPIFAAGAGAENLCGIYEAHEVMKRAHFNQKKK